jgi:hypothetical protein
MATRKIVNGPGKWDLLVEAIGNLKPVEFTIEKIGKRLVRIMSIGPEDGSGDKWLLTLGELDEKAAMTGRRFKAFYNSRLRVGFVEKEPQYQKSGWLD